MKKIKKLIFLLVILLATGYDCLAQVTYCASARSSVSPNTSYSLNYTCRNVSGTTYEMKLEFANTTGGSANANIGANPGGVNVAANPVWSNANKTLTYTFTAASTPTLYVATIFVMISGTEVRWDLPTNANFAATCATLPAPVFGPFTVGPKVVGDADSVITPPTSDSSGAFTYTSSNANVATIVSGNQLRITGFTGTSTITAIQAADATHIGGNTTATLTVTSPNPAPTFGAFTVGPKLTTDADFVITPPTSNSAGTFSYTSSNTAVATIVNTNQIHIVGAGTSTITAIQAFDATHTAGKAPYRIPRQ